MRTGNKLGEEKQSRDYRHAGCSNGVLWLLDHGEKRRIRNHSRRGGAPGATGTVLRHDPARATIRQHRKVHPVARRHNTRRKARRWPQASISGWGRACAQRRPSACCEFTFVPVFALGRGGGCRERVPGGPSPRRLGAARSATTAASILELQEDEVLTAPHDPTCIATMGRRRRRCATAARQATA